MSKKSIIKICEYQGIKKAEMYVKIKCPSCNNRTLYMNVKTGKGCCATCNKKWHDNEVLRLVEESYLEEHEAIEREMRNNKGVGY